MHPHETLIHRFYERFQALDGEGMAACYHPDVVFSDPVFGELRGPRAGDMWRMLTARAKDLRIEASRIQADDAKGSAHWVARYSFGKEARPVVNEIDARFAFRDGLIVRHDDTFSLTKWAGMALGPTGKLLGWTPMVQRKIRANARRGLDEFVVMRAKRA